MLSEPGTVAVCRGILDASGGFWGTSLWGTETAEWWQGPAEGMGKDIIGQGFLALLTLDR